MTVQQVTAVLLTISPYSAEVLATKSAVIENSIQSVTAMLKEGADDADDRAVYLAAARANYDLLLSDAGADSVSTFKAGDVSITENKSALQQAERLYQNAAAACAVLLTDSAFAFLSV